jgi:hypothetical protein
MPDTPTPSPAAPAAKVPFRKKGNPAMPPQQVHHARRGSRAIRALTRIWQQTWGKRATAPQRDSLAYFTIGYESGERPD